MDSYVRQRPRFGLMCDRGHILDSCATGPAFCSDVRQGRETQVTLQTLTLIAIMVNSCATGTTTATFCRHVRQGPRFAVTGATFSCDKGHVLLSCATGAMFCDRGHAFV